MAENRQLRLVKLIWNDSCVTKTLKAFLGKIKADTSLKEKLKAAKSPEDVVDNAKKHSHELLLNMRRGASIHEMICEIMICILFYALSLMQLVSVFP